MDFTDGEQFISCDAEGGRRKAELTPEAGLGGTLALPPGTASPGPSDVRSDSTQARSPFPEAPHRLTLLGLEWPLPSSAHPSPPGVLVRAPSSVLCGFHSITSEHVPGGHTQEGVPGLERQAVGRQKEGKKSRAFTTSQECLYFRDPGSSS